MKKYLPAALLLLAALLASCAAPADGAAENTGLGQPRRVCQAQPAGPAGL